MSGATQRMERAQWRQLGVITAAALGIYFGLRWLPTGTNLSHMDFRVDPKAGNAIEFCDPLNPQFIPVVAARSPVALEIARVESGRVEAGKEARVTVRLKTGSGKPVAPEDLLVTHTRPLHLLVVDPTLRDYQHVHPTAEKEKGEWTFAFTPRTGGTYRVFGDFTPAATGRGLYASVDLTVAGSGEAGGKGAAKAGDGRAGSGAVEEDGYRFTLDTAQRPVRAGQPVDLRFAVARPDGGPVRMEPVMGAYAHLVAFDETRSGFAHLHPAEADLLKAPDERRPELNFKLTIPRAGRYVVWAQVSLEGRERFVPFEVTVAE